MMIIDMHAHLVPAALEKALRQREQRPSIVDSRLAMPIGEVPFGREFVAIEQRIEHMDWLGVTMQVLSLPSLFGVDSLPAAEAVRLTRLFNEGAADACAECLDRFRWLACLPLDAQCEAEAILHEAMSDPSCIGMILPDLVLASRNWASRIEPYLAILQDHGGGHLFVHPGYLPGAAIDACPYPDLAFARRQIHVQTSLAEAAITILHSNLMARFPDVTVQIANLAGTLPMVVERIDKVIAARGIVVESGPRLGQVVCDCASMGPRAIALAHAVLGPGAVVFGSDCPIFELEGAIDAVSDSAISSDARDLMLYGTASHILETNGSARS